MASEELPYVEESQRLVPVDGLPPEVHRQRCDEFYLATISEPREPGRVFLYIKIERRSHTACFEDGRIVWRSGHEPFEAEDDGRVPRTITIQDIDRGAGLRWRLMEKIESRGVPEGCQIDFSFSEEWSRDIPPGMDAFLPKVAAKRRTVSVRFGSDGSVRWSAC